MQSPDPIGHLLERVRAGDEAASAQLFELAYGELRARAGALLAGGAPSTLQATALVHEAWLKLRGPAGHARDRGHFLAVAAKAMRSVLIDHARAKGALKRGPSEGRRLLLDEALEVYTARVPDMLELHDELERLASLDPRLAQLVELRFFGGLTVDEIAEVMGLGRATVERDWRSARAYLAARLAPVEPGPPEARGGDGAE
jgi:RNA polymerase sigma factor (TIGR02999 family)